MASDSKYIKVINSTLIDKYKIAQTISDQCSITVSDVVAVMQAYETNLMMQFANGNSVEIFNLGTLKPCFKAEYDASGNVIKKSLRLSKVSLITSDKFVQNAKGYGYKFCGDVDYNQTTFEQRIDNCISYLKDQNTTITSHKYAIINQCSESTAKRDFSILAEQNLLFLEREITVHGATNKS